MEVIVVIATAKHITPVFTLGAVDMRRDTYTEMHYLVLRSHENFQA